jgi:hypothetical protein
MEEKRYDVLLCACSNPNHQVAFWYIREDGPRVAYVTVQLTRRRGFWLRLVAAWRYLWNLDDWHYDEVVIDSSEASKVRHLADWLEEKC